MRPVLPFEQIAAMVADDVNWYEAGASEPLRGKEAVFSSLGSGGQDFEIEAEVPDVVANDDHTLALVNATGKRGDETFHYQTVETLHLRDGRSPTGGASPTTPKLSESSSADPTFEEHGRVDQVNLGAPGE